MVLCLLRVYIDAPTGIGASFSTMEPVILVFVSVPVSEFYMIS